LQHRVLPSTTTTERIVGPENQLVKALRDPML
jgi:hypothetical protein